MSQPEFLPKFLLTLRQDLTRQSFIAICSLSGGDS
jgi:hypothetical protein